MHPQLFFLHGFLGEPSDFDAVIALLQSRYSCKALLLHDPLPLLPETSCVIGYSMGGRVALQNFPNSAPLILIGTHLGLNDSQEQMERKILEEKWTQELLENPESFIKTWYEQPLFATLASTKALFEPLLEKRKKIDPLVHIELLSRYSIRRIRFPFPSSNVFFLFGEWDKKYSTLYSGKPNAFAIPKAGHAAHIENPKATADMITFCIETHFKRSSS